RELGGRMPVENPGSCSRRKRLRSRGGRPHPALRAAQIRGLGNRRLRPQRYARGVARVLRGGCPQYHGGGARRLAKPVNARGFAALRDRLRHAAPLGPVAAYTNFHSTSTSRASRIDRAKSSTERASAKRSSSVRITVCTASTCMPSERTPSAR